MSEPRNTQAFWVGTIVAWLAKNAGVGKERLDLKSRLTQEPYNLSVVKVLNMMDDLVATYKDVNKTDFALPQNWRLAHRGDTAGDFIAAFLQMVAPEAPSAVAASGTPAPAQVPGQTSGKVSGHVSESGQRAKHNGRLEALRANPAGDWTAAYLEIIASQFAIKFRKVTGTHEVFLHPSVPDCVTVPLRKKIRAPHIKAFVAMIDRMDEFDR